MSSSIGGISNYGSMMQYGGGAISKLAKPDPDKLAEQLFSGIDTSGKGYIELGDLQSAVDKITTVKGSSSADANELFTSLDADSDGKVTKTELSDSIRKLAEQLESQLSQSQQTGRPGPGRMPPPPGGEVGFSKEELAKQLQELGESDSERSAMISTVIENFDTYDSNGDGKVNFEEVMAQNSQRTDPSPKQSAPGLDVESTNTKLMRTIMQLLQSYGDIANRDDNQAKLSVNA